MSRIERLQKQIKHWDVEALLIENPIDLFYLTGLDLSKGRLVLRSNAAQLLIDGRYLSYASLHAPCPVGSLDQKLGGERIGVDSAWMTVDAWNKLVRTKCGHIQTLLQVLILQRGGRQPAAPL